MSEDHNHHFLVHNKEEDNKKEEEASADGEKNVYVEQMSVHEFGDEENYEKARKEETHHNNLEHGGELGAMAGGGFALMSFVAPAVPSSHQENQGARNMAAQPSQPPGNYPVWNFASPLNLGAAATPLPAGVLGTVPEFDGVSDVTAYEHCMDVIGVAHILNIIADDVRLRLLAFSFKGKARDWFRNQPVNSFSTWAELAGSFVKAFGESADPFSLLTQFTSIKRYEQETVSDFNLRFIKTWGRVPVDIKPPETQAYMYYLRAFAPDLSLQIRNTGVIKFPLIYSRAIECEATLILVGKLPSRIATPYFPHVQPLPALRPMPLLNLPPIK